MKRGIASDCTGELSSEQFIRQLRDSGKNEPVIEMFVIEAKTIERCRVATVARLREIEKELEAKMRPIENKYSASAGRGIDDFSVNHEWLSYYDQRYMVSRLLDYFSRPARYEAMVRRNKDA